MGEVSDRIANLSPQQLELLMKRLVKKKGGDTGKIPRIERDRAAFPLSASQQRLWFLEQLVPGTSMFNIPMATRLRGILNVPTLEQSLREIVRRHETLRTHFTMDHGQPVQVIEDFDPGKTVLSVSDVSPEAAMRIAAQEAARPFDLAMGPLLRVVLLRLAAEDHILLVTMHHTISDGWSLGVFLRELVTSPGGLPELPIQYIDFAAWQRQESDSDIHLDYWREQFQTVPPVLELPTDGVRPALQTYRGTHYPIHISPALTSELRAFCQQEGVTLFMLLLAAYNVLLYRYTGQEDITVGVPIANRSRPELEDLIGFFVNTLVLRTDLSGNPTFRDLLQHVRQMALGAYDHQNVPFEKLVEQISLDRDLNRSPLFQTMFVHMNAPAATLKLPGLDLEVLDIDSGGTQYDLSIYLLEDTDQIGGFIEYNTDLFTTERIERLLGHWLTLLEGIVAQPDHRIAELPLLTESERQHILVDWNATQAVYPTPYTLHELVETQVARTPDAIAAVFDAGGEFTSQLTYAELNRRANQLAHTLIARGVGSGVHVGLYLERSLDMLVAMLGVLKAGGTYIPLDPAYPADRIAYTLEDSGALLVLTQGQLDIAAVPTLCLDSDIIAQTSDTNPQQPIYGDTAAYMIYTSGSTGKPKGVRISHRGAVNFLHSMQHTPGLSQEDTLLAVTTLSFDIAVLELWLPLMVGARVVVASRAVAGQAPLLRQTLTRWSVSVMQATPATWRLLLASGWEGKADLRILCGGEAFPRDLADALVARCSEVWNMYGPTETTVWSAVNRVTADTGPVPVGAPISNTQFYVLDRHLQPMPVGVPGELFIGGDGLALGYWNRLDLTAEKFIPNPFDPTTRLYRTGDLVRYRSDGTLDFLGRLDHQVKVRGFRIELGEIESVLGQAPGVSQVVVVAREDIPGDKRLVAYVVADQSVTVSGLRAAVHQSLPDYMVPAHFVFMERLPLTPNGKINRLALPVPDQSRPDLQESYIPPRNPTEQRLADIWQQVLGIERVGIDDNFFNLGGHSLLATQLAFQMQSAFQTEFPLLSFFERPTIAHMAELLAGSTNAGLSLPDEVYLDPAINPAGAIPFDPAREPQHIFLTGVTGFVGAFLLNELLAHTPADVYCLVRADDELEALDRIRQTLQSFCLSITSLESRVIPVVGDLAQLHFGLSDADFESLSAEIDVIYHSGAITNFIYPYSELKATNVGGTHEILRLASQTRVKAIHFVSTLYVFSPLDMAHHAVLQEDVVPSGKALSTGYTQSKWVAEQLVRLAQTRGIPVSVYRLGRVSGHTQSGACRDDDFVWQLIKACIETGYAPDIDGKVDMVPVDDIARHLVQLSRCPETLGQVFHLFNPQPPQLGYITDWVDWFGFPLTILSYAQWHAAMVEHAQNYPESAAAMLVPFLSPQASDLQLGSFHYGSDSTRRALPTLAYTPVNEKLFKVYLTYFVKTNFIDAGV